MNKEERNARTRAWRKANPEKCQSYRKKYSKAKLSRPRVVKDGVCLKCGGTDITRGHGCRPCRLLKLRFNYASNPYLQQKLIQKATLYRANNYEKVIGSKKKRYLRKVGEQPFFELDCARKRRDVHRGWSFVHITKTLDENCRFSIRRNAKLKKERALRKLQCVFEELKELAMTKPMTFQLQAKTMTTEELFNEFSACSVRVSEGLYRMAVIWMELENRGENLSLIKTPFRQFFPDISSGRLLPEVALEYGGSPKKVEIFSKLLPEDQRKIVGDTATVALVVRDDEGKPTIKHVNPIEMRLSETRQVFGGGRIRSPEEQNPYLPTARQTSGPEVKQSASLDPNDFHLWYVLSGPQRDDLARLANMRKMTASEFVRDLLERTKAITKSSSQRDSPLPQSHGATA